MCKYCFVIFWGDFAICAIMFCSQGDVKGFVDLIWAVLEHQLIVDLTVM